MILHSLAKDRTVMHHLTYYSLQDSDWWVLNTAFNSISVISSRCKWKWKAVYGPAVLIVGGGSFFFLFHHLPQVQQTCAWACCTCGTFFLSGTDCKYSRPFLPTLAVLAVLFFLSAPTASIATCARACCTYRKYRNSTFFNPAPTASTGGLCTGLLYLQEVSDTTFF